MKVKALCSLYCVYSSTMIEALDEDEGTPEVFEFVVGMACGHIL